jgi:hypothetical protein
MPHEHRRSTRAPRSHRPPADWIGEVIASRSVRWAEAADGGRDRWAAPRPMARGEAMARRRGLGLRPGKRVFGDGLTSAAVVRVVSRPCEDHVCIRVARWSAPKQHHVGSVRLRRVFRTCPACSAVGTLRAGRIAPAPRHGLATLRRGGPPSESCSAAGDGGEIEGRRDAASPLLARVSAGELWKTPRRRQ